MIDKYMIGFEKEQTLRDIHNNPEVRSRLYMWSDFMAVMRVANPQLCDGAFERRECRRKLQYIGDVDDDKGSGTRFEQGQIYESVDFNGATYTMKNGVVIGSSYWVVVEDYR